MDILGFLKEKKNFLNQEVHPYAYYDNNFKYIYCFGVGVITYGNIRSTAETKKYFQEFLDCIMLHQNMREKLVLDISNHFDYKINDVFALLDTKEKQYTFISDLFLIVQKADWAQNYCKSIVEIYMKVFRFTKEEKEFFSKFSDSAGKGNYAQALNCYQTFINEGLFISYKILKYIFPSFTLQEEYANVVLDRGERLLLDKPVIINGDVIVKNGSSLQLEGASLTIRGSIIIDDGRISIKNSKINVESCDKEYFLMIRNVAVTVIEDSEINCNLWSGFIKQEKGFLIINNTKIENTSFVSGIYFDGHSIEMNGSSFLKCKSGAIALYNYSIMNVDDCEFTSCYANQGGAIYSESLYPVSITNSRFNQCEAKYIGGAVCFAYKKYGQVVHSCEMKDCLPADSMVFNDFSCEK